MWKYQEVTTHKKLCICNRCRREMSAHRSDPEYAETISISFRAGYGSVFGDGSLVEGHFCQHCVHELLGKYLHVTLDQPFDPRHQPELSPGKARQPNQDPSVLGSSPPDPAGPSLDGISF